jgi:hypothetical protein
LRVDTTGGVEGDNATGLRQAGDPQHPDVDVLDVDVVNELVGGLSLGGTDPTSAPLR